MAARPSLFVKVSININNWFLQPDKRLYKEDFRQNVNLGGFKSSFNPIGHSDSLVSERTRKVDPKR